MSSADDREAIFSRVRGALAPLHERAPMPDYTTELAVMRQMMGSRDVLAVFTERITLANGKTLTSRVQRPLGRTSANPVPQERMRGKFDDCCRLVLTADAVAQAWRVIDAFETEPGITRLMQCLTPAAKPAASAA